MTAPGLRFPLKKAGLFRSGGVGGYILGFSLLTLPFSVARAQERNVGGGENAAMVAPEQAPVQSGEEATPPPSTASGPDMLSSAPVDESEFGLDLDESMDIGVAWPDMDGALPDIALPAPDVSGKEDVGEEADSLASGNDRQEGTSPATGDGVTGVVSADGGSGPDNASATAEAESTTPDSNAAAELAAMTDDGAERRYRVQLDGLDEVEDSQFRERFNTLSSLKAEDGKPANLAQINRRMQLDADLIDRILRAKGYYGAIIRPSVTAPQAGDGDKLNVTFSIRPGIRYTLATILLPGLAIAERQAPQLQSAFPIAVGDPIDADKIVAAQTSLAAALGENGFPFANVEEPQLTVDHETRKGDLEVVVRAGGYRRFGGIQLDGETSRIFTAKHLMRIARFDRDDVYQVSDVEDLRRAIVATGLASSVEVKPVDAGDGEHADIAVSVAPAPMRTVAGEIGYGTGEGYRLEASWQHRNFFPPEGAVTARGLLGTKEQAIGVAYRRNNFWRRDNILSAAFSFRHQDYDAYQAKTISLTAGLERQSNLLYQKKWVWSVGTELLASRERDYFGKSLRLVNRDYLIAALPVSLTYDASDDLLDPTRGFRLGARVSPEVAWQGGSAYTYARTQVDGSVYLPVSDKVVVASRARLGSILGGVDSDRIAPSRRFYAGGGASVRGYAYQAIGPRDADNDPVGGKSLAEFSLEARIRMGVFGVVPFLDAGNISTGFLPKMSDIRYGAGLGLRYYSTFGPIRIDVGTPVNRQAGDSRVTVYVSLGQAF
ncbi:MAG: BamA/TamA family outer membrane protein [Sphingobium sp.]